ncbi:MAG: hypothetical protein HUJ93_07040, partial [Bacteroidales bacterium]|nr:hypothetical protein [Bacteroidales bacterium]
NPVNLTVIDSIFNDNSAPTGGAINGATGTIVGVSNSTFNRNTATSKGGAINGENIINIDNSNFINNTKDINMNNGNIKYTNFTSTSMPIVTATGSGVNFIETKFNGEYPSRTYIVGPFTSDKYGKYIVLNKLVNDHTTSDTLYLNNTLYVLNETVTISKNIVIHGGTKENPNLSSTVNGLNTYRLFYINGPYTVKFININFINGYAPSSSYAGHGAAILTLDSNANIVNLDVINSTFNNNIAGGAAPAVCLFGSNSKLNVTNSKFTNNKASGSGHSGAIYCAGTANIDGSIFINNTATNNGGAIWGNTVNVNGSKFYNNTAEIYGGAIYGKYVDVFDSIFINNTASSKSSNGGAIYIAYNGISTIDCCIFENNSVLQPLSIVGGSAIYGDYYSDTTVKRSNFTNNYAVSRGVIYMEDTAKLNVTDCNFINNNAGDGGAIASRSAAKVYIYRSNFINNSARIFGGALFGDPGSDGGIWEVYDSNFINNTATKGGAISIDYGRSTLSINNSYFINNSAKYGGAIYGWSKNLRINRCIFINNTFNAIQSLTNVDGPATISNSEFYSNNIPIIVNTCNNNIAITNTKFNNDNASKNYITGRYTSDVPSGEYISLNDIISKCTESELFLNGTTYVIDGTISLSKSIRIYGGYVKGDGIYSNISGGLSYEIFKITGNCKVEFYNINFINGYTFTTGGGAIYVDTANVVVNNCNFINGSAFRQGGAIYMTNNANVTINNSNFFNNRGIENTWFVGNVRGGAIYANSNSYLSITNSNFTDNGVFLYRGATGGGSYCRGGAIYLENVNAANIINSTFSNNSVNGFDVNNLGGAIFLSNSNLNIQGSKFINNSAIKNADLNLNQFIGGAIYATGANSKVIVNDSSFTNNYAFYDGGAIYIDYNVKLDVTESNFTDNKVSNDGDGGGAILLRGNYNGNIIDCNFTNNSGPWGGAIYAGQNTVGFLNMADCYFINNTATNAGGAILTRFDIIVNNSTFINNTALNSAYGGG